MTHAPAPLLRRIGNDLVSLGRDALRVYWILMRVMVPAIIVVKALDMIGATQWLAWILSPAMHLVGLPESVGIVWATTLVTNIYTGMAVFFVVAANESLTVAQVTVLSTMMLVAHALPVEGAIARTAGMTWRATLALRLGGAMVLGALLNLMYRASGALQQTNVMHWQPAPSESGLLNWAQDQLLVVAMILPMIALLMLLLRALRLLGIERLIHAALSPILNAIGIGRQAVNTTVIGITLGLSYGGGLLIREAQSGAVAKRDILLTLAFLNLCHSLIEDTLLLVLLGADLSGILWARLAFSLLVVGVIARLMPRETPAAEKPLPG